MQKIRKKMTYYLVIILILALTIIASAVYVFLQISDISLLESIIIFVAVVLSFVLMKIYNNLTYLKHEYVFVSLLENKEGPVSTKTSISNLNFNSLLTEKLNYTHYISKNDYILYYKVVKGATKRKKHSTLYAVLIYKKDKSFIDNSSNNMFESLENYLHKKEKYSQRIFIQLKETSKDYTKEVVEDTDKIFFISTRRNNIIVLNLLFNKRYNNVYYLHSKNIKLPLYLKIAFEEVEKII